MKQLVAYQHKALRAIILLVLLIITIIKSIDSGLKIRFNQGEIQLPLVILCLCLLI